MFTYEESVAMYRALQQLDKLSGSLSSDEFEIFIEEKVTPLLKRLESAAKYLPESHEDERLHG